MLAERRPDLEIAIGYLDHGSPRLADLSTAGAVVVPLLLSTGFHVQRDIPAAAPDALLAAAIGPDLRLVEVVADRVRAAGWDGRSAVVLAATGSADPQALADARTAAAQLADVLGVDVEIGFVSGGEPLVADLGATTVASYLLAPGHFADEIARLPAGVVSDPIGADGRVVDVILDRYDAAVAAMQPRS